MTYNSINEIEVVTDLTTEPVTLNEQKAHMNMFFETSGSYTFTDDDTYITDLIKIARQLLESYTGLVFGPKSIKVAIRNECGGQELPGPVGTITSVKDSLGVAVTSYTLVGNQFKTVEDPYSSYLLFEYAAGYAVGKLPAPLKRAIMEQVQFMYDNRGSQKQSHQNVIFDLCTSALELSAPFKRISFLA